MKATIENSTGLFEGEIREKQAGQWVIVSAIIAKTNAEVLQFFADHGVEYSEIEVI